MQQTPFSPSPLYAPYIQPALPMRQTLPLRPMLPPALQQPLAPLPAFPQNQIAALPYVYTGQPAAWPNTAPMNLAPPMGLQPPMPSAMSAPMNAFTAPSFGNAIPDAELVKSKLTMGQGLKEGLKSGALFSLIAGVPIWLIEKFRNDESLIHMLSKVIEAPIRRFKGSDELKFTDRIAALPHFAQSMGSTVLIGLMAGSALGPWIVSSTKKKLIDINQMKTDQQQGTFKPKRLSVLQALGLQKKPSNDPDQDYQNVLQNNLNSDHAFKQGATTVLLAKVIPGLASLGLTLACIYGTRRWGSDAVKTQLQHMSPAGQKIEEYLKETMLHPVMLAKMAALPIMGGFIAQQTVPWMKRQIGIENQ